MWPRQWIWGAITAAAVCIALALSGAYVYRHRSELIHNKVVQNYLPFLHSLRKLPDVLFFPYYFRTTSLPVYTLDLSPSDIQTLNNSLPADPFGIQSLNELDRVDVRAAFQSTDGYDRDIRVRYRGSLGNNWNTAKKSYLLDFPNAELYKGMKEVSLFLPHDRDYFVEALNMYRARKLGLRAPEIWFVRLNVNNRDQGVYAAMEHWSQEWLEKAGFAAESNVLGIRTSAELEGRYAWKSWNIEDDFIAKPTSPALGGDTSGDTTDMLLQALTEVVDHASDRDFERYVPYLIDLPKFYAYDTVSILSGSYHGDGWLDPTADPESEAAHSGDNNLVLVFNTNTGLFEPIPYNISISDVRQYPEGMIPVDAPQYLTKRIHAIPAFREARDRVLSGYVSDPQNLEDDMRYITQWEQLVLPELYTDTVKLETNFEVRAEVRRLKDVVRSNFELAKKEIGRAYPLVTVQTRPISFRGSFESLPQTVISVDQFLRANPIFYKGRDGYIHLGGSHTFTRTTIVPKGTRLVIDPGATIRLGKDVSFISYSPVTIKGGIAGVRFLPASTSPWGNFAVVNALREESIVENAYFEGGGDTRVNGIHYSGMLTFKDSDARITNVTITRAQGDDGIHLAYGTYAVTDSTFTNNWADAIDADFASSARIENNMFVNTLAGPEISYDGDAADISGTNAILIGNVSALQGDKGFSVGEGSTARFERNVIVLNPIGVAVKDLSTAEFVDNIFARNDIGISLYLKKNLFGGGIATSTNDLLYRNGSLTEVDNFSSVSVSGAREATEEEIRDRIPATLRSQVFVE